MRIAQVTPHGVHPYSGLFTSLVHLAVALARSGLEVEVWQLHQWPTEIDELVELLDAAGVERVTIASGPSPWRLPPPAVEQMMQRGADVAHLHGVFSPKNNLVARKLEAPFVVSPHGGYAKGSLAYHRGRKAIFKHVWELPMLRRSASMAVLTQQEAREVRRFGASGLVAVIPNGAPPVEPNLDRDAFRAELGLGSSTPLAVYAGRIDVRAKRLDQVVRSVAATELWHVALLGGDFGNGIRQLTELSASLGASNRIHIPGPRRARHLHEALAAADVFVLISKSEGWPMALLEALALGTPAVVSPEVELATGVAAAGSGWVTAPKGLAVLLGELAGLDRSVWEQRRRAAFSLASSYDWADVANRYKAVYEEAITQTDPSRPEGGSAST